MPGEYILAYLDYYTQLPCSEVMKKVILTANLARGEGKRIPDIDVLQCIGSEKRNLWIQGETMTM